MADGYKREKLRAVRVSDEVWDAAAAKARKRGESVSEVIRRALKRYGAR